MEPIHSIQSGLPHARIRFLFVVLTGKPFFIVDQFVGVNDVTPPTRTKTGENKEIKRKEAAIPPQGVTATATEMK